MKPPSPLVKAVVSTYLRLFRPSLPKPAQKRYIETAGFGNRAQFETFVRNCRDRDLEPIRVLSLAHRRIKQEIFPSLLNSPMFMEIFLKAKQEHDSKRLQGIPQSDFREVKIMLDSAAAVMLAFRSGGGEDSALTEIEILEKLTPEIIEPEWFALRPAGLQLVRERRLEPQHYPLVRDALLKAKRTLRIVELLEYAQQRATEVFSHAAD